MKVSLIYPYISVAERYGTDIGDIGGRQAPLGILYLSSFLKKLGHEVQLIDAEAERLPDGEVIGRLKYFRPECVGISITTVAYGNSLRLADSVRKNFNGVRIVAGGPHVTANPAESIADSAFDFGICGEGELTFAELLENMHDPAKFAGIRGLVYKDSGRGVLINERRVQIQELDELPYPDRDALASIKLYRPPIGCYREDFVVSLITSRGCPYNCIFCDNNTFGRKIRCFTPEYVAGEIESVLKRFNAKELTFVDDTFPSNRKRFRRVLELIKERNLRFSWTCMANANDLDEEILKLMRAAGCWQIAIGIESGDDEILRFIKKGITTGKVRETANSADRAGMMVKGFFMLGNPTETRASLGKTRDFALSLPLTDVVCTIATPIRGTELYELASSGEYGKFNASADSSKFNYWEPVFVPYGLSEDDLYGAQRDFYKSFYLRPSVFFRQLKKIRSLKMLGRTLKALLKILKMKFKAGSVRNPNSKSECRNPKQI
ncbi:MAG: radical SAM protein [Victivallales bacterium]